MKKSETQEMIQRGAKANLTIGNTIGNMVKVERRIIGEP
jgi:hypothetical protein